MAHKIGNSQAMDRRRFLRNAAVTTAAVPTIMTLTAPGALAAPCTAATQRNAGCTCTVFTPSGQAASQCITGTTCQTETGQAGTVATPGTCTTCKAAGASTTASTCNALATNGATGTDATCCTGTCTFQNATQGYKCS